jgi:short-subunit dehydrogenase
VANRTNILITGASSGLGAQMAREFAARGRNLALCARRLDRLDALRTELLHDHPGVRVEIAALDVTAHGQVFDVFHRFNQDLDGIDRVIVNAGVGKGSPIGTGRFDANLATATTNFVAALAQCEAAMELFRARNAGHLVVVSSMSALRGLPGHLSTYSATKAGIATLAEAIRADTLRTPITVTTLYPGYIASEINSAAPKTPLIVDTDTGVRAMVKAIEREPATAKVPAWPWIPIGWAMQYLPLGVVARVMR